jgi:hypothetical protein
MPDSNFRPLLNEIRESIEDLARLAVKSIQPQGTNLEDSELYRSMSADIVYSPKGAEIYVSANFYYKFVDSGRRAGALPPPYSAILDWIQRKKIKVTGSPTGAAIAISRAIGKRGIAPRPFVEKLRIESETRATVLLADGIPLIVDKILLNLGANK